MNWDDLKGLVKAKLRGAEVADIRYDEKTHTIVFTGTNKRIASVAIMSWPGVSARMAAYWGGTGAVVAFRDCVGEWRRNK